MEFRNNVNNVIKFFKVLSKEFIFRKMQFCQIGGGVTIQPDPKNSWIFSGQIRVKHSVRDIVRHIYVNFQPNLRHRFPTSHTTITRPPEMIN
jgi:hypothetical protein